MAKPNTGVEHRRMSFPEVPETIHTSYLEALMHVIKGNVGVGLFAMGYAFKNGGLIVSPILTFGLAFICIHCQHLLLHCTDVINAEVNEGKGRLDYSEALELCFAIGKGCLPSMSSYIRIICNIFITVTQFGFCCIYLTFISTNLVQILSFYGVIINIRLVMMIVWVPAWLSSLITSLKALAPVSITANVCILSSFIFCIYFALKDGFTQLHDRQHYTDWYATMIFLGAVVFSFEGIALVLPVRNSMEKPKNFGRALGVLNVGMSFIVTMYMVSGLFGYMRWGEEVGGTLTVNIGNSVFATFTKLLVSLGILLTYPLQFYVPISVMAPFIIEKCKCNNHPLLCELIFRTLASIGTLLVAEVFPDVAIFISLIGALCSTVLALVFPPMMECILLGGFINCSMGIKVMKIIKNCFILSFAFFTFVLGTYVSIMEIVKFFVHQMQQGLIRKDD